MNAHALPFRVDRAGHTSMGIRKKKQSKNWNENFRFLRFAHFLRVSNCNSQSECDCVNVLHNLLLLIMKTESEQNERRMNICSFLFLIATQSCSLYVFISRVIRSRMPSSIWPLTTIIFVSFLISRFSVFSLFSYYYFSFAFCICCLQNNNNKEKRIKILISIFFADELSN